MKANCQVHCFSCSWHKNPQYVWHFASIHDLYHCLLSSGDTGDERGKYSVWVPKLCHVHWQTKVFLTKMRRTLQTSISNALHARILRPPWEWLATEQWMRKQKSFNTIFHIRFACASLALTCKCMNGRRRFLMANNANATAVGHYFMKTFHLMQPAAATMQFIYIISITRSFD